MKELFKLMVMFIGPIAMWYPFIMFVVLDWNCFNWHWTARATWMVLSIFMIGVVFNIEGDKK